VEPLARIGASSRWTRVPKRRPRVVPSRSQTKLSNRKPTGSPVVE
jgi:hypothetical protein